MHGATIDMMMNFQNSLHVHAAQVVWHPKGPQSSQGLGSIRCSAWHPVKRQHHPGPQGGIQGSTEAESAPGRENLRDGGRGEGTLHCRKDGQE